MKTYYRRLKSAAWILAKVPQIKCVILNGSYATGEINRGSDIDFLIIATDGRIFTARFFAILLMTLLGIKRSSDERENHAGKVCLNYFLTESFLKIPTGRGERIDRYCAENYSQSEFLIGDAKIFEKFLATNQKFFAKYQITNIKSQTNSKSQILKSKLKNHISHFSFLKTFGNFVEARLKNMQIRRIESDPITKKYPDLIVYNDKELRFHPPKNSNAAKL